MQEIFFTILVIWILFRVLNSSTWTRSTTVNYTQNNYHKRETPKEGETKITHIPNRNSQKQNDEGEYVDFEEID